MIIFGTGNYENVKQGNRVSVTGDGGNAWGFFGPSYKKLAPRLVTYLPYAEKYDELVHAKSILSVEEYNAQRKKIEYEYILSFYETRLKDLDVKKLLSIFKERFGEEIILLCHEEIWEFCHRRLLADYIELLTGIYIPEVAVDEEGHVKKLNPIRYKNRLKKIMK